MVIYQKMENSLLIQQEKRQKRARINESLKVKVDKVDKNGKN